MRIIKTEEPRVRSLALSGPMLLEILNPESKIRYTIFEKLPPGAKFVGFSHDVICNCVRIFVEHESFDPVPLGEAAPYLHLVVHLKEENKND